MNEPLTLDDMNRALTHAKDQLRCADALAYKLANMLVGRLRKVDSGWLLAQLKRELKGFNSHTKKWAD